LKLRRFVVSLLPPQKKEIVFWGLFFRSQEFGGWVCITQEANDQMWWDPDYFVDSGSSAIP